MRNSKKVFFNILDGDITVEEFNEWLEEYAEQVVALSKTSTEVDLQSLTQWANSEEPVWDSFEVGYETARLKVRKLLGNASE